MSEAHPLDDAEVRLPARGNPAAIAFLGLAAVAGLGVAAGAASANRWFVEPHRLAFSYLTALLFVTTVSVGSLAWLLLHHVTGAVWSVALRRLWENLTRPLPWVGLLFIPVLLTLALLYPWADPARVSADAALARKAVWLNPAFFAVRTALYVSSWVLVAGLLGRASSRQDGAGGSSQALGMRARSTWGLILVGVTSSCAGFDWMMSLDAHWTSTMFGVYFWAGSLVGALAAMVLTVLGLHASGRLRATVTVEHLHDLGKLLFAFVVFWSYIAFSQYFLIWYSNIPEETRWYVTRRSGDWNELSWALVFGHFVVPFVLLLPRATKRSPFWLGFVAAWVLVFHYLDLFWLVMPALHPEGIRPHWLDVALVLALAFACCAVVARACGARPLVPVGDPALRRSIAARNP